MPHSFLPLSRIRHKLLPLSSLALTALLLFPVQSVKAQVSLSPIILESQAKRNQAQAFITVRNTSDKPFRARVYAKPFTYTYDGGFQELQSSPTDLTPYLQFSPRELVVQPGMVRRIRLLATLPPNLSVGEYRSVIFTENLTEQVDEQGNQITLATRVGATFYVRQGAVSPKLTVEGASWNTQHKQIQLIVKNAGQASTRPEINWTLKRGATTVKTGSFPGAAMLAQNERSFLLDYPTNKDPALSPGQYQLSGELVWGENKKNHLPFNVTLDIK